MGKYNLKMNNSINDPEHVETHNAIAQAINDLDERVEAIAPEEPLTLAGTPLMVSYGLNLSAARPDTDRPVIWLGTGQPENSIPGDTIFSTTPIIGDGGGGEGFIGILDGRTTPFRAHSLRRLSSLYLGDAIRVRRSSDNTEANIGFTTDGDLDVSALTAFVGAESGFVTTFFDQSGFGRHFSVAASGNQPRIVNAGTTDLLNGKPTIRFDGTDDYLLSNSAGLYAAGSTSLAFVGSSAPSSNSTVFGEFGTTSSNSYRLLRIGAGTVSPLGRVSLTAVGANIFSTAAIGSDVSWDGNQHQLFLTDTGSLLNYWRDNNRTITDFAISRSTVPDLAHTAIGGSVYATITAASQINIQEVIAWGSNESSTRVEISTDQREYWGTL